MHKSTFVFVGFFCFVFVFRVGTFVSFFSCVKYAISKRKKKNMNLDSYVYGIPNIHMTLICLSRVV